MGATESRVERVSSFDEDNQYDVAARHERFFHGNSHSRNIIDYSNNNNNNNNNNNGYNNNGYNNNHGDYFSDGMSSGVSVVSGSRKPSGLFGRCVRNMSPSCVSWVFTHCRCCVPPGPNTTVFPLDSPADHYGAYYNTDCEYYTDDDDQDFNGDYIHDDGERYIGKALGVDDGGGDDDYSYNRYANGDGNGNGIRNKGRRRRRRKSRQSRLGLTFGAFGIGSNRTSSSSDRGGGGGVISVACGYFHTCCVTEDGLLLGWGAESFGCSDCVWDTCFACCRKNATGSLPALISSHSLNARIERVSCGWRHSAAVSTDGRVFTWGDNNSGQLGHGDDSSYSSEPTVVESLWPRHVVKEVRCGDYHTVALTAAGNVYTWGDCAYGELGHGVDADERSPRIVRALKSKGVRAIACGHYHTLALTVSGEVYAWGRNSDGQLGTQEPESSGAIKRVKISKNSNKNKNNNSSNKPSRRKRKKGNVTDDNDDNDDDDDDDDDDDYSNNNNNNNNNNNIDDLFDDVDDLGHGLEPQLGSSSRGPGAKKRGKNAGPGIGPSASSNIPTLIRSLPPDIISISCGGAFSAAVCSDGRVFTWGRNRHGQLGHGDEHSIGHPKECESLRGKHVTQIACGESHAIALTSSGDAYAFGSGIYGRCGVGDERMRRVPVRIPSLSGRGIIAVSAGWWHSAALTADGALLTWGGGEYGQLGHGDRRDEYFPRVVAALKGRRRKAAVPAIDAMGI